MPATRSVTSHGFERRGAAVPAGLDEGVDHHDPRPRLELAADDVGPTGRGVRLGDSRFDQANAVPATGAPGRRVRTCAVFDNDPRGIHIRR